jgi:hypothetical protein
VHMQVEERVVGRGVVLEDDRSLGAVQRKDSDGQPRPLRKSRCEWLGERRPDSLCAPRAARAYVRGCLGAGVALR